VLITCAMGSSPLMWNPLVKETKRRLFFVWLCASSLPNE